MSEKEREHLVTAIASLSDPPDLPRFKNWLRSLNDFKLRERYEIILEQNTRDAYDYGEMMRKAEERLRDEVLVTSSRPRASAFAKDVMRRQI